MPSFRPRRPSAALIISSAALFVSLGGVGYAAVYLPANSVGNSQIRNNAVTYKKIQAGSVGTVRANTNQLQARVGQTCAKGSAIGAIDTAGKVTCNPALPAEFGTTGTVAVPAALTSVANLTLPAGSSYMTFANPTVTASSTSAEDVNVTCTLTDGPNTQTRTASVPVPADGTTREHSLTLMVAGPAATANVSCKSAPTGTTPANVSVTSAMNALQTSSNN